MTRYEKRQLVLVGITVSMTVLLILTPLTIALSTRFDELARQLASQKIGVTAATGRSQAIIVPEKEVIEEPEQPQGIGTEEAKLQSLGTFKLTAYCSCEKCCGEWADGITYTGTVATPDRTIAVDPSVIPLGSTIYINGQPYIAEDIGGAIKGNRIDIFFPTHNDALKFGIQYAEVVINKNNAGGI